jgi:hypothetical protein
VLREYKKIITIYIYAKPAQLGSREGRIAEKTVGGRVRFQRNSLFNGFYLNTTNILIILFLVSQLGKTEKKNC